MYAVLVEDDFGISRDEFLGLLRKKDVDTRTFFISVHRQPVFVHDNHLRSQSFPVSDELARKGFYLPSGLALTPDQLQQTCQAIKNIKAGLHLT
jgi:perosamine synthetase